MPKPQKRMKGVPASVPTRSFRDIFDCYVDGVSKVHGKEVAETYRTIREGEALVMDKAGVDYPDAQEQQRDFLSFHIDSSGD